MCVCLLGALLGGFLLSDESSSVCTKVELLLLNDDMGLYYKLNFLFACAVGTSHSDSSGHGGALPVGIFDRLASNRSLGRNTSTV